MQIEAEGFRRSCTVREHGADGCQSSVRRRPIAAQNNATGVHSGRGSRSTATANIWYTPRRVSRCVPPVESVGLQMRHTAGGTTSADNGTSCHLLLLLERHAANGPLQAGELRPAISGSGGRITRTIAAFYAQGRTSICMRNGIYQASARSYTRGVAREALTNRSAAYSLHLLMILVLMLALVLALCWNYLGMWPNTVG